MMNPMNKEQFFECIGTVNRYSLLDRMKQDCLYYLGNGRRYAPHLWGGDPKAIIRYMKWLWLSFEEGQRPEWLTMQQIDEFDYQMNG